jgi:hypothetical protein
MVAGMLCDVLGGGVGLAFSSGSQGKGRGIMHTEMPLIQAASLC